MFLNYKLEIKNYFKLLFYFIKLIYLYQYFIKIIYLIIFINNLFYGLPHY